MAIESKIEVTIEKLSKELESWRANKKSQSEKIPEDLWQKIILLHKNFPEQVTICRRLGITKTQLKNKLREIGDESFFDDPVELCKIPKIQTNPSYKQANDQFSALSTLVVEFCRDDGCVMKIHTTTQSVQDLIDTFLGDKNATNYRQA